MKITCESCSTKYSVADEKVAGRTIKIRCKRCGAAIMVRGGTESAAPATGGEWHVIVEGEPQGPFALDGIAALLAEGAIDSSAYVWREGHEEWSALSSVGELAHLARSVVPIAGADLFASMPEASFGSDAPETAMASASLTGSRNESSVLFSLSNLQALSTAAPAPASQPKATSTRPPAMGDGSGLIDIRALAAAAGPAQSPRGAQRDDDELLSMGTAGLGSMTSPLGAPVIVPEPKRGGNTAIVALGVAGAVVAAAAALVVVVLVGQSRTRALVPPPSHDIEVVEPPRREVETPAVQVTEPASTQQPESQPELAPGPIELSEERSAARVPSAHASGAERRAGQQVVPEPVRPVRTEVARRPRPEREEPRVVPVTERAPRDRNERSIERLLDETVGREPSRPERVVDSRPPTPSRSDVTSAMNGVSGAVRSCGDGSSGLVSVRIVFTGESGRVQSSEVQGASVPPDVRSCVARAVRDARVPSFQQSTFSVTYPFRL